MLIHTLRSSDSWQKFHLGWGANKLDPFPSVSTSSSLGIHKLLQQENKCMINHSGSFRDGEPNRDSGRGRRVGRTFKLLPLTTRLALHFSSRGWSSFNMLKGSPSLRITSFWNRHGLLPSTWAPDPLSSRWAEMPQSLQAPGHLPSGKYNSQ